MDQPAGDEGPEWATESNGDVVLRSPKVRGASGERLRIEIAPGNDGARRVVRELRIVASDGDRVTPAAAKGVSIQQIEAFLNRPAALEPAFPQSPFIGSGFAAVAAQRLRAAHGELATPRGGRYPDDFYMRVADAYQAAVEEGKHPAPFIALHVEVPVRTVREWVRQARSREFLGPATQGRAG